MRWPDLLARAQMKGVAGNVAVDVRKQIFVRGGTQAGRSALPLDCESASYIDIGERADWAFIRLYVAVTMNSYQVATSRQNDIRAEKNNRNLLHTNMISLITMQQRVILDSTNVQGGASLQSAPVAAGRPTLLALTARFSSSPRPLPRHRRRIPRDNRPAPNRLRVARA